MPSMLLRRLKLWAVEIAMTWQEMEFSTLWGVWWKITCPSRLLRCFAAFLYTWYQQKYQQKHASLCSVFLYGLTFVPKDHCKLEHQGCDKRRPDLSITVPWVTWKNTSATVRTTVSLGQHWHHLHMGTSWYVSWNFITYDHWSGIWLLDPVSFWSILSQWNLKAEVYTPMSHGLWFLLPKYNLEKLCWIPCVAQECSWQKHHIADLSLEPRDVLERVGLVVCSHDWRKHNPTKNRLD